MAGACDPNTNGFVFCYGGNAYSFPAVPTSGGPWGPSVQITTGPPLVVTLDWVNLGGESMLSRAARWVGRRFGY